MCEEPVTTIGLVVGTLAESEADDELHEEESYIDDDNGGFSEPDLVREARLEDTDGYLPRLMCVVGSLLLSVVLTLRSRRGRLTQMKGGEERVLLRIHYSSRSSQIPDVGGPVQEYLERVAR